MSSVSSVGGSSLSQWLQQLNDPNSTASSTSTASALASAQVSGGDDDGSNAAATGEAEGSGEHHGHHGHHGVASRIESAVTSALSSAPPGSDPNQVIADALKQLLGGDTTQGSTGASPIAIGGAGNDGTGTAGGTAGAGANQSSQQAAFSQLLSSYGVSGSQFQQDLQSALQGSSDGGGFDFAKLFQNFPPGSAVDVQA